MNCLVLPQSTAVLINSATDNQRHPGLQLDKFSIPGDQEAQKTSLDAVCRISGDSALLASLSKRRNQALAALPAASAFRCDTTGPLTLHLSRASALENAGICLHPLYGFAYLPGSGLKGMARAYAETVWSPTQDDPQKAWAQIEGVFGWAPSSDRGKDWKPQGIPDRAGDDNAHVGAVIFHDAWPTEWPKLFVDIVNNHHPDYYQNDDNQHASGDWENPVPVYFLAVKPGTAFTFPLSKRRADVPDDLLALARQWLLGALCHLGAGAKTNAGYGAFKPVDGIEDTLRNAVQESWENATAQPGGGARRAVFETTLELVTPAFLAGANQYGPAAADGCDLRPATLRGHLRWWWRTMHAEFLDVKTLRTLEAAIWGDTRAGGAVRIVIEHINERVNAPPAGSYDKQSKANFNSQQKGSVLGIPNGDPQKTTQGLWYASYGMDEGRQNNRRQRCVLEPPAPWRVRLIARPTRFYTDRAEAVDPNKHNLGKPISAQQALDQAKASLWLLCHFGAVGSKARKGFGSLAARRLDGWAKEKCQETARQLRAALGWSNNFNDDQAHSSSLHQMLDPDEVAFS